MKLKAAPPSDRADAGNSRVNEVPELYKVSFCKAYEVWVPYSALLCILVPEHDEHLLIIVVFLAQWWNF